MPYKNPEKQRQYLKTHYQLNSAQYKLSAKTSKEKRRQIIHKHKDVPCADCGMKYPYYVMDFDHMRDKEFNVALKKDSVSYARLEEEIAKCEVVCANCHRIRTWRRLRE